MELFIACDVEVAGRRTLRDIDDPTPEQLSVAIEGVQKRRDRDRNRRIHPFVDPAYTVPFTFGESNPQLVIGETWTAPPADAPYPIEFDTTCMPFDGMGRAAQALAKCALNLVE